MPRFLNCPTLASLPFTVGVCLLMAACSTPELAAPATSPANAISSLNFDYRVGPGDVLRVNVAGHPDLSSAPYKQSIPGSPVDGRGTIQLPYIGAISVSGMTVFEIKEKVEQKLKRYLKRPAADIAVVEFGSKRVFVLGEVQNPGMFILDRPMTALQALSLTGGFTGDADRKQIALFSGPIALDNLKAFDATTLEGAAANFLKSNDLIFVRQRGAAGWAQWARDLVPVLQLVSLPVGTARDVALFQDIRDR